MAQCGIWYQRGVSGESMVLRLDMRGQINYVFAIEQRTQLSVIIAIDLT